MHDTKDIDTEKLWRAGEGARLDRPNIEAEGREWELGYWGRGRGSEPLPTSRGLEKRCKLAAQTHFGRRRGQKTL